MSEKHVHSPFLIIGVLLLTAGGASIIFSFYMKSEEPFLLFITVLMVIVGVSNFLTRILLKVASHEQKKQTEAVRHSR